MTPYADVTDITAKYSLTATQSAVAEAYLEDASILVRDLLTAKGKSIEDFEPDTIVKIVRDCAYRGLSAINAGQGVNQYTQSAVGYSETFQFANPQGDLYLTKTERRLLGLDHSRMFTISPYVE